MWLLCDRAISYLKILTLKKVHLDSNNNFTLCPEITLNNYISIYKEDEKHVVLTTVIEGEPLAWVTCNLTQLDTLIRVLGEFRNKIK